MQLNNVVLPDPFGPIREKISFSFTNIGNMKSLETLKLYALEGGLKWQQD